MTEKKPKIFLSYAHEDIGMAKRIYQDLKRYGLNIWFDNESLLGGQNWKFEINKAIKESTFFLAVLSNESIDSIGYVQKELKMALEMLDLYPKNKTYILPVRIEDCEPIEERLRDLHWINVFPDSEYQNGLKKILQVVSPAMLLLRNTPRELTEGDAAEMIRRFDFYDNNKNPEGRGFTHQYKVEGINRDKVVIDEVTGLMWQKSGSPNRIYLEYVSNWISKLNYNGFAGWKDWRLPTLEEAMSLMEREKNNDLYIDPIFDSKQRYIWTADQVKSESWMRVVGFYYGYCYGDPFNDDDYVRAVRSGQSSQE